MVEQGGEDGGVKAVQQRPEAVADQGVLAAQASAVGELLLGELGEGADKEEIDLSPGLQGRDQGFIGGTGGS